MILLSKFTNVCGPFPREEVYGLTSQLRRAAYSVPANIVERASRESKKDYLSALVDKHDRVPWGDAQADMRSAFGA